MTTEPTHPLLLLERAAMEYAIAVRSSRIADMRAADLTGERGARAAVLAARARTKAIDALQLLQRAAIAYAAHPVTTEPATERAPVPKHLAHELLDAQERARSRR